MRDYTSELTMKDAMKKETDYEYYTRKKQEDCGRVFSDCNNNEREQKMIRNMNRKATNDKHYCKIQTEPFSHEGRKICVVTSRRGGWKNHGVKGSGCTSQNSAEYSALKSLINQISKSLSWRDSEIGEWVILEQWSIQNPRKYEQLRTEIRKHIAWTEFENGNSRNGMISHSAMNNAIKAVFA